jgi:murein DD-endopeptidase MepM/ murein hydrolase activator NlpD
MRRALFAIVVAALFAAPAAGAWTWPAGGAVLQTFSFDHDHPYAAGQSRGIAIGGAPGAAVPAPAAGLVTFAGTVPGSGPSVTVETADGYAVTLTHLGAVTVRKGDAVAEGATVGTLEVVEGAYVHLGIRVSSDPQGYVDPLSFLPARTAAGGAPPPRPSHRGRRWGGRRLRHRPSRRRRP